MGDRTYTTVCAWPWPGEHNLSVKAREELGIYGFAGIDDAPGRQLRDGALLEGDENSGRSSSSWTRQRTAEPRPTAR